MTSSTTTQPSPSPNTATPRTLPLVPQHLSDFSLLVGEAPPHQILLHVDTRTLRTHSTFFEAMLRGPWLEVQQSSGPVKLPDDDPAGMELLCRILYHELLPETPEADVVVDLTAVCDKYDLGKVVGPHIKKWVADLLRKDENALWPDSLCFIGWTLGFRSLFESAWKDLVNRSYNFRYGPVCVHSKSSGSFQRPWPYKWVLHNREVQLEWLHEGTEEALETAVEAHVHALHKAAQGFVTMRVEGWPCAVRREATESQCNAMIVGGLIHTLRRCGIALHLSQATLPVPAHDDGKSVQQLLEDWCVKFRCPTMRAHERCSPTSAWRNCLKEVLEGPVKLTGEQVEHFKRV